MSVRWDGRDERTNRTDDKAPKRGWLNCAILPDVKRIGIYVERHRAWGRLICEGVCAFAQTHDDWSLAMLEREDFASPTRLSAFDGFIARVPDATVAQALAHTRRPVADLTCEAASEGRFIRAVWQDNAAVGKLAARHFIEHRFTRFAFCGYADRRFSDERRDAFARCLRLNRFETAVYAAVHRSHTRVDAAFRERLGTTVQAEIRRVALDEARRLLATTGLSVADVARRAGFASPQYFCNVFTAAFGQPPSTVPRGTPRPPRASARTADGPKAHGT